jgi:hypothetical protein
MKNFGDVLKGLKENPKMSATRRAWRGCTTLSFPVVMLQLPDKYSKMTEPYLYMKKAGLDGEDKLFPVDLSCESLLAEDWELLRNE